MSNNLEQIGTVLETDVLIIGGGLAGKNAAIGALEKGASVLIAEKGYLARSGSVAGGVDHFAAYLNTNDDWDTRKGYLKWVEKAGRGAVNLKVHDAVFCSELPAALERMERINTLKLNGEYYRMPGPYFINFDGKLLSPRLAKEVRRLGGKTVEKTAITGLLTDGQKVTGAVGFHIRTGEFYIIKSKATILATGSTNRLFENPTGFPFNTQHFPGNTGAGNVMAFELGVKLANMEYTRTTVVPKGFEAAGLNAMTGIGGKLINAAGEDFMLRYSPLGSKAPRSLLAKAIKIELNEGRGPIYIDFTHLPKSDIDHLIVTLGYDKDTLPDYLDQKGIDLSKEPLEISYSAGEQSGPSNVCGSGILIDEQCRSSIEGLFACGTNSDQMNLVHMCTTGGYLAGKVAADYAKNQSLNVNLNYKQIQETKEKIFAPLKRSGNSYHSIERTLAKVMGENLGCVPRSERTINAALEKIEQIEKYYETVSALNYHELMRSHEVGNLIQIAKIMCYASLARKESRFDAFFWRSDFPETDDQNYDGQIVVWKANNEIKTTFKKLSYNTGV